MKLAIYIAINKNTFRERGKTSLLEQTKNNQVCLLYRLCVTGPLVCLVVQFPLLEYIFLPQKFKTFQLETEVV